MFEKKVFISHSSKNKDIAEHLCAFIARLGVKEKNIFCSSVIGQGIANGEKLNTAIATALKKSNLLVFLISHDFIESSYCLEELGAGWFLAHQKRATCYYLVLPDIELSEVVGFVNSKIDKFSFIDPNKKDDLGTVAEDIINELKLKQLKFTTISNIGNNFFSSTDKYLAHLVADKEKAKQEKSNELLQIISLKSEIEDKNELIATLKERIESIIDDKKTIKLKTELLTIEKYFTYLGYFSGISKKIFSCFNKDFWFSFVNNYLKLNDELKETPDNDYFELLVGTIYAANNDFDKAYLHIKTFVKLTNGHVTITNLSEFLPYYKGSMKEIIDILVEKASQKAEGVVRDSYLETIQQLKEREKTITM